ncbi:MAG: helix-turn-helix domain-containing protein [Alphaproteobacteria bacterium]
MGLKKRTQRIGRLTRELLAEGESSRVDFKRQPDGISAEDIVAFANSDRGGNILAGVDEKVVGGAQIGVIRGCDVSDATILQILNKSVGCIPPVSINVYIENLDNNPILRIEIPSSRTKPHCTPKGIYCQRDGARNRPLHPSELLKLFLDSEASSFAARFEVAANRITEELGKLESSLDESIRSMSDQLGWADIQFGDTESTLHSIESMIARIFKETDDISTRLRTLFRQDEREDPVKKREHTAYINRVIKQITENKDLLENVLRGGSLKASVEKNKNGDVSDREAVDLLHAAVNYLRGKEEDKKYSISVKKGKDCTEYHLDQIANLAASEGIIGGEFPSQIRRAYRVGLIVYDRKVVGTAILHKPTIAYRDKIFKRAGSMLKPKNFPYKVGWIFLDSSHRKKGQLNRLMKRLESAANGAAIFAVSPASNEFMKTVLSESGFIQDGNDFSLEEETAENVNLFIREAQSKGREAD